MARPTTRKWSQEVTDHSNALDLTQGVFKLKDPKRIAASLEESAEHSERRKADPYRSAMSMLTFYINRAGAQLQPADKQRLERAKEVLRGLFHRPSSGRTSALGRTVKKPGSGSPAEPSGQRDGAKHEGKHANK
jgi:hypothetical protein